MKRFYLLILLLLPVAVNAQKWKWARATTCSSSNSEGVMVRTDQFNNVFVLGNNQSDSICVGPFSIIDGSTTIAKYDSSGNALWVSSSIGGGTLPFDMALNEAGELYVFGIYGHDSTRIGSKLVYQYGYRGGYYVAKYSPSGSTIWVKAIGDNYLSDFAGGISIDNSGNVYFATSFHDTSLTVGSYTFTNAGGGGASQNDILIVKIDPTGSILWAKSFGGNKNDQIVGIAAANNIICITGNSTSPVLNFGSATVGANMFLAALDTSGNALWAKSPSNYAYVFSIGIDRLNDIYLGGEVFDTIITFGSTTFQNANTNAFLLKYNNLGSQIWGKCIGPAGIIYSITCDPCNNVWVSGTMGNAQVRNNSGYVILDSATMLDTPMGSVDPMFFAEYSPNGRLQDYKALTSGGDDVAPVAADGLGNIYLSGDYAGHQSPFIIGNDTFHLYNFEAENIFLAKYEARINCNLDAHSIDIKPNQLTVYPNPTQAAITITSSNNITTITVANLVGQTVYTQQFHAQQVQLDVSNLPTGMYILRINGTEVRKFVKE